MKTSTITSTEMTGLLSLRYSNTIEGKRIDQWISARCKEMPDGALVRLTFEVLDPHPPGSEKPVHKCEKCEDRKWISVHDPSADGHGGLNGGEWITYYCPDCNPKGVKQRFPWAR